MKGNLIGPDNQKFEADIIRYFQNVNDKYLIYSKNEKDSNGFILLYVTKVISDNGIKIGENIVDENEWSLIKNFLKQTVNENKENKPLTIIDINPIEINDLKINASRPFKLQENVVELFGKNKKSFEIVQQMIERENTAIPVAPEVTEFVKKEDISPSFADFAGTSAPIEENKPKETVVKTTSISEEETPSVEATQTVEENAPTSETNTSNFEEMYNKEVQKNEELTKQLDEIIKDNADLKAKIDKIKELIGLK